MTYNRFYIRQLIGRALGIDRPNPQLWGLIIKKCGGAAELQSKLKAERISYLALSGLKSNVDIPCDIIEGIEKSKLDSFANNLYLLKVFERISVRLSRDNIAHTPIKGLDLIRDFYADPAIRPISDIDVLVKPTQFDKTVKSLIDYGFTLVKTRQRLPGVWPAVNLTRFDGIKPVWIDLHYCLGPAVGNRIKATLAMFDDIPASGSLPPEYRVVVLAAHHQNHFMDMPIIAYYEIIRLFREANREKLKKLAREWEVADALISALNRAAWIFGIYTTPLSGTKNAILNYLTGNELRIRHSGFSGFESLIYLLSLNNPGVGIPFGLELLRKKITSGL